jgi:hypothetical protein
MIQSGRIRLAGRTRGSEEECITDFGGKARRKETTTKAWKIFKLLLRDGRMQRYGLD